MNLVTEMVRGRKSDYLYPPTVAVKIPVWAVDEVKRAVREAEVHRLRGEISALRMDLREYCQRQNIPVPSPRSKPKNQPGKMSGSKGDRKGFSKAK